MLLEIIIFIALGILAGTFTGLAPGIHINLVGAILVALSASILFFIPPIYLVIFIASMSITHTFVDFIPSIFLGCPNDETGLSVLPGHELLKEGKGHSAILFTAYGGLAAVILVTIIAFPLIFFIKKIYPLISSSIPYILIGISLIMILSEKKKFSSLIVYALTGILGIITLNLESLKEPLLPLLTGLFGSASLIISIKSKTIIPPQTLETEKISIKKPLISSLFASTLCGFLPGLGSAQAATLGNTISKSDRKEFLALLGATNVLVMSFSFLSLYAISKTRTGSAVVIKEIMGNPSLEILILILGTILISGVASFYITKTLSILFSKNIHKINYSKLSIATIVLLMLIVFIVSSWLGVIVFIISTFTGIYCINSNVKRTNMMACLLLPTILLYLKVI